jgi:hypothetical protein
LRAVEHRLHFARSPLQFLGCGGDGREQIEGVLAFADLPEPGAGALAADQHLFDGLGFQAPIFERAVERWRGLLSRQGLRSGDR